MAALRRVGRITAVLIAACCLVIASRYALLVTTIPELIWPLLFGAAGVLSIAWVIWPWHRLLWIITGTVTFSAFVARSVAILVGWAHNIGTLPTPQVQVAFIVWALAAGLYARVWIGLAPLQAERRTLHTISPGENTTPHFSKPRGA